MMTKYCMAIMIVIFAAEPVAAEEKASCYADANTQLDLNDCGVQEWKEADDELNHVYQEILKLNSDDKVFLGRLKEAQRAWLKFRDAELEALFPEENKQLQYGSSFPMCYAQWLATITKQRTQQLKKWLTGVREGELCSGSLPVK